MRISQPALGPCTECGVRGQTGKASEQRSDLFLISGAQKQCFADMGVVFSSLSTFIFFLPINPGKHLSVVPSLLIDTHPRAQLVVENSLFDKKTLSFVTYCLGLMSLQSFLLVLLSQDL